jgi:hypothetical protein
MALTVILFALASCCSPRVVHCQRRSIDAGQRP